MDDDRGPNFGGVRIGRPAVGGLLDAGFVTLDDLPERFDELADVHGVGPKAIRLLREERAACGTPHGAPPVLQWLPMDHKQCVSEVMGAMSRGRVAPLFEAMAEDVTWSWMGVDQWSRTFEGKQTVVDKLFGGATETLGPASSIEVRHIHVDGDCVVVEHAGRNQLSDGRRYDNNYCWVLRFRDGLIQEVREYMDTQLVTETFGADATE